MKGLNNQNEGEWNSTLIGVKTKLLLACSCIVCFIFNLIEMCHDNSNHISFFYDVFCWIELN